MALDDSKRKLVVGILRPGAVEPELREMPNEAKRERTIGLAVFMVRPSSEGGFVA